MRRRRIVLYFVFAAALVARPYDMERLAALRAKLDEGVKAAGGMVIGEDSPRLPTIGAVALPGASSASLLVQFDLAGIAVSADAGWISSAPGRDRISSETMV